MDTSSLSDTSVSHGNNSEAIRIIIPSSGDDNSIDKLSTGLSSKLKIHDENQTNNANHVQKIPVDGYYIDEEEEYSDAEEEEEEDEYFSEEELLVMGYAKSTPNREKTNKSLEESILAQMFHLKNEPPKHEPITTPTAELNLVSAIKGSREKEGVPAKECRVSWAPDVYDPPPNVYDPPPTSKVKGLEGKNRQKGGGKRAGANEREGGGGKGKKGRGSKGGVEKGKTAGKYKDKKYGDKKLGKKRGGGSTSKYSEFGEF